MGLLGNILRGVLLALVLGLVAIVIGVAVQMFTCADGGCAAARGVAGALGSDGTPFNDGLTALLGLIALLTFGLAVTMVPDDPVRILAALFTLLLGVAGYLLFLGPLGATRTVDTSEIETASVPETLSQPEIPVRQEPEPLPSCPAGTFRDGRDCAPCTREVTTAAPARLSFVPVRTDAHWVYASSSRIAVDGRDMASERFTEMLADQTGFCSAPALLVIGSASSDGSLERNERRAVDRARGLAGSVSKICNGADTYALSLGQSDYGVDVDEDRPVSILQVFPVGDAEISGELILTELGYALASDGTVAPLLSRRERFPRPWQAEGADPTALAIAERPQVTRVVRALGAPDSCPVSASEGLDGRAPLRQ